MCGGATNMIFFHMVVQEETLNAFIINSLNEFQSAIKLKVEYSAKSIQFLNATIIIETGSLKSVLFAKPTDTRQVLESSFFHPYHCKFLQSGSPTGLDRMYSDNFSFDKRCNDLECWLTEREYSK